MRGQIRDQFERHELTRVTTRNDLRLRFGSVLISERIEPWHKKLLLFGSLRLERLDNEYIDYLNRANSATKKATQPTYSVGGVARPFGDKLSFFGNVSTGFTTSTTIDRGTGELQENPRSRGVEAGVHEVRSNYAVIRTMEHDGSMAVFSAGQCRDRIVFDAGEARFLARHILFDSKAIDTLLVIPL